MSDIKKITFGKPKSNITKSDDNPASPIVLKQSGSTKIEFDERMLHGSGLTKKLGEASERAYNRAANASMSGKNREVIDAANASMQHEVEDELAKISITGLPSDFQLGHSQLVALQGMLNNKRAVMIGKAGTGKTTTEKALLECLKSQISVIDLRETRIAQGLIGYENGQPIYERMTQAKAAERKVLEPGSSFSAFDDEGNPIEAEITDTPELTLSVALVSFTGKAVQQIKRAIPKEFHKTCMTIHSLLGYAPVEEEHYNEKLKKYVTRKVFRPTFGEDMKLPYDCIIIDEAGMVPATGDSEIDNLWNNLMRALKPSTRIYLIGDIYQLPPVMGKSILGYAMNEWPVFELDTIYRQAADNGIIAAANEVLNGRYPMRKAGQFDMVIDGVPDGSENCLRFVLNVIKRLHREGQFDPIRDVFIVPQNSSHIGQENLNSLLVTYFNPERFIDGVCVNKRIIIHTGMDHVLFAVGDKVMVTSNDKERGLTNGMVGLIEEISLNERYDNKRAQVSLAGNEETGEIEFDEADSFELSLQNVMDEDEEEKDAEESFSNQRQSSHKIRIKFTDGHEATFRSAADFSKLKHAYAVTCHKMQGSECHTVVVLAHRANVRMLTREWLYTAITRGRERCILIANENGLQTCLQTQRIKGKTLTEKLKAFRLENKIDDMSLNRKGDGMPIIWPAN